MPTPEFLLTLTQWAQADPNDEKDMLDLQLALAAAEGYLAGSGVRRDGYSPEDQAVKEMALLKMSLYFFDHRDADARYGYVDMPTDVICLINQLRTAPRVP